MESKEINVPPKFCGNILVRRTKRRSFINRTSFVGVFGVLTDQKFEYYQSSEPWTKKERPLLSIKVVDIQAVDTVDDTAFSRPLCFQVTYTSHTKKDESSRTVYLAAYEADEFQSWTTTLRSACADNPIFLAYFHPGRFTGKAWTCCSATRLKECPGCKPSTIPEIPDIRKQKLQLSPAIEFCGFTVVANEPFDSTLPESLPFKEGEHLTITDAAGKQEWKAFSASSTSGYGVVPRDSVTLLGLAREAWFFGEIPTGLATAILREQAPGCFILRRKCSGGSNFLSFRTHMTVKHVEIVLDESSRNYRIKDESDSVSYANFLQFESIQQLMDQCKQHPTLGVILDKYPTLQNVEEIWRVDWNEVSPGDDINSTLPWAISHGKFRDQPALIHTLREGSSNSLQEKFTNHARILMNLRHESVISLYGIGTKGARIFMIHSHLPKGNLSSYLTRNASLLSLHPSELVNIASQILLGMVYLEESGIAHGDLVADNCLVGENGVIKISGFHCARSSWCSDPLEDEDYTSSVVIPAPELEQTTKSDAWAYGLLVYTIITAGQKPITTIEKVLKLDSIEDILDQLNGFTDVMTLCLRTDPETRPTFKQLQQRFATRGRLPSTPSASSYSLEGSLSMSNGMLISNNDDLSICESPTIRGMRKNSENPSEALFEPDQNLLSNWNESISERYDVKRKNGMRFNNGDVMERLKLAELTALKAKVLQKRAEAEKEIILNHVQDAEAKCLKEVEYITRTFMLRLNEATDRATEAEQSRYIAEEIKRLTEEKFTLFKYESERNIHDMKSLLDETALERDELMVSLKTFGIDVNKNDNQCTTLKRTDSIKDLENKYQRYISTSDRTIQNLKSQLKEVVYQRDALVCERDLARMESKETKVLLEEILKEKEDLSFRLEESSCEVERLEETISSMMHERNKAERERDQLQILTDMSLMKLRQAEKPKKRHSVCTTPSSNEGRELRERRDPNLRRLSMQLMNLMTPAAKRRNSTDTIYETSEVSSSDDAAFSSRGGSEDENSSFNVRARGRRRGRVEKIPLSQVYEGDMPGTRRVSTPKESDSEIELMSFPSRLMNGNYNNFDISDSEDQKERSDSEQEMSRIPYYINRKTNESHGFFYYDREKEDTEKVDSENCSDMDISNRDLPDSSKSSTIEHKPLTTSNSLPFPIPTLHIEDVSDLDDDVRVEMGLPEIEISLIDENETNDNYFTDEGDPNERMFIINCDNGDTRLVYSYDDAVGSVKGVPQTTL